MDNNKNERHFLQVFKFQRDNCGYYVDKLEDIFEELEDDYNELNVNFLQKIRLAYKSFESIAKLRLNKIYVFEEFKNQDITVKFEIMEQNQFDNLSEFNGF